MGLKDEFKRMVGQLENSFSIPPIEAVFLPPFYRGGQPKDSQFMALVLKGGATGISYILLPDSEEGAYNAPQPRELTGRYPREFALEFGGDDPVGEMIGMVGLFSGLVNTIRKAGAELVIIEKRERLAEKYHDIPITTDITRLAGCTKILCTGTTVLNNSLDDILQHCSPDAFISVVGPTAGYFPDPLFACGVDVVGGRVVKDSADFLRRLSERERWEDSTLKTCFQRNTYRTILNNR